MTYQTFIKWAQQLIENFSKVGSWLITPIVKLGNISIAPLTLFGATGLIAFVAVAVIKWGLS